MPEYAPKMRLLHMITSIMERPRHYTLRMLSELYQVDNSTIKRDFNFIRDSGFALAFDEHFRYYFLPSKTFDKFSQVLQFTRKDQELLIEALDLISAKGKMAEQLKQKIATLHNMVASYGGEFINGKINLYNTIGRAIDAKKKIHLKNYLDNDGNKIKHAEIYHMDIARNYALAYIPSANSIVLIKLNRIKKLEIMDENWQHEQLHRVLYPDPFGYLGQKMTDIILNLNHTAYLYLLDIYPHIAPFIKSEDEKHVLRCQVNSDFKGLDNFILAQNENLKISSPTNLVDHMNAKSIRFSFGPTYSEVLTEQSECLNHRQPIIEADRWFVPKKRKKMK